MKKGFTLIELLAVIIVLSVIALITVPTIINVVDNSKEKSRISSVNSLIDATRLYMNEAMLDSSIDLSGNLLNTINNRVKGIKPSEGEIKVNGNDIGIAVKIDGYCYIKDYLENEIRKTNDNECIIFKEIEASDYVMNAFDAVINYEACMANLPTVLQAYSITLSTNEELDKACKNELELIQGMLLKEAIMYLYYEEEDISAIEETQIAKFTNVKEKGYEKCFQYENSEIITDFDINYDVCMELIGLDGACKGEKTDLLGDGNLITLKGFANSNLTQKELLEYKNYGLIENIKTSGGIKITNYLCYKGNEFGLPTVTDVVIPTTINAMKVIEIADVELNDNGNFSFLIGLTSVDFSGARYLEKIGVRAFFGFWPLFDLKNEISGEIDLSNLPNLKEIGAGAFAYNQITSLKLSDRIISIGSTAFDGNQLPDDEAFIYKRTDNDNDGIAEIDSKVLVSYGGAKRKDLVFPSNIEEIEAIFDGNDGFNGLSGMVDLSQTKITEIYRFQFAGTGDGITEIKLPETLEKIYSEAFFGNPISGELDLSNLTNLTEIGYMAFGGNQLTSVKLPNSVTTIGDYAFNGSLTLIEIDNIKDAISGSPWGAENATVTWLRDSE